MKVQIDLLSRDFSRTLLISDYKTKNIRRNKTNIRDEDCSLYSIPLLLAEGTRRYLLFTIDPPDHPEDPLHGDLGAGGRRGVRSGL